MKLDDGHELGPKHGWADWRARRDKSITKPRRGKTAEKLERLKRKAKS